MSFVFEQVVLSSATFQMCKAIFTVSFAVQCCCVCFRAKSRFLPTDSKTEVTQILTRIRDDIHSDYPTSIPDELAQNIVDLPGVELRFLAIRVSNLFSSRIKKIYAKYIYSCSFIFMNECTQTVT